MLEIVAGMFQSFDGVMELPDYYHDRSFLFSTNRSVKPVRGAAAIPQSVHRWRWPRGCATSLTSARPFTTYQRLTKGFGSCVPSAWSPTRVRSNGDKRSSPNPIGYLLAEIRLGRA